MLEDSVIKNRKGDTGDSQEISGVKINSFGAYMGVVALVWVAKGAKYTFDRVTWQRRVTKKVKGPEFDARYAYNVCRVTIGVLVWVADNPGLMGKSPRANGQVVRRHHAVAKGHVPLRLAPSDSESVVQNTTYMSNAWRKDREKKHTRLTQAYLAV